MKRKRHARKNSNMEKRGEVSREERRESRKHVRRRETLEGGPSESHGLATVHRSSDLCREKHLHLCSVCATLQIYFSHPNLVI